jgi:hypothetical protein
MSSTVTGSAQNIYLLIEEGINQALNGKESAGIATSIEFLVQQLNKPEYKGQSGFSLSPGQLQRNIYNKAKKLVNEKRGELGLKFIAPYLDRLCMYVHKEKFINHFDPFDGILYDIKEGIEGIPRRLPAENNIKFIGDIRKLGITGTANQLSASRFEPKQCTESTKYSLFFMGLLGSKWVKDLDAFRTFLKRVQSKPNAKVKFLMINPHGESFKLLKTMRGEHLKDESTVVFRKLVDEFECMEARFYDFLPCFRLIFIDDNMLALSRYKLDENNYIKSKMGWEAPHLVIDGEQGEWSLYEPFLSYYKTIWTQSLDIKKVIKKYNANEKGKGGRNSR